MAQNPPGPGERVLFCIHAKVGKHFIDISQRACIFQPFHWYFLGDDNEAARGPGGKSFPVRWLAICDACHGSAIPDAVDRFAAQDAEWIGAPPNITPQSVPS